MYQKVLYDKFIISKMPIRFGIRIIWYLEGNMLAKIQRMKMRCTNEWKENSHK